MKWSLGSRWLRWDPHLHAPGTLRNNQFADDWDGYIHAIECADPVPCALGITDYFSLGTYKELRRRRETGALADIALIFPNIELRLSAETRDRSAINLHLLVCPDDPNHVERMEEKLAQLRFRYRDEVYPCSPDGMKRLGRAHRADPTLRDDVALSEGANQFKAEFGDIREMFEKDPWIRANVLVAIAAGKDGLSGIAHDASFRAQREELGRFADVVFSGNPRDRQYWLGNHPDFQSNAQTPKPCLHGSDAHSVSDVLQPQERRRCWIRAEPTFDGIRQTLIEPERRVHIGEDAPATSSAANVIRALRVLNAPWLANDELTFNEGLVTVIGAKGSGKTALAEFLALAAGSEDEEPSGASFIAKAGDLLDGVEIEIEWGDGTPQSVTLPLYRPDFVEPRVRYLSQQFVDRLCSPHALAEPLVEEIERVVFSAIHEEDRLQCATFGELRSVMQESASAEQEAEREIIRARTRQVAEEASLHKSVGALRQKLQEGERERKAIEDELKAIPVKVSEDKVKAQQQAVATLTALKAAIAGEERRAQELRDLSAEMQREVRAADLRFQQIKAKHPTLLTDDVWSLLRLRLPDEGLPRLSLIEELARTRAGNLRQTGTADRVEGQSLPGPTPAPQGLGALTAEADRLTRDLGLDETKLKRRGELEKRLPAARTHEEGLKKQLDHALKAPERWKQAQADRLGSYENVFNALMSEKAALEQLYRPLLDRIAADARLGKLSFVVRRVVDVEAWVTKGEALLDLRKPPFQGRGALATLARSELLGAWQTGTPAEANAAMKSFLDKYANPALDILRQGATPLEFGEWLFTTDHITVRYGIQYEGGEVQHLSPGTRGVVLLTLYLALDEWDERPLVIDQPEENLDPRSVYQDLVPFFRDAAKRRQIIMVTHNANLVVNTDSDQVIVAEAERVSPIQLPNMSYSAGGLEDSKTRSDVCSLLEGGKEAFKKRGQRYAEVWRGPGGQLQ